MTPPRGRLPFELGRDPHAARMTCGPLGSAAGTDTHGVFPTPMRPWHKQQPQDALASFCGGPPTHWAVMVARPRLRVTANRWWQEGSGSSSG